MDPALHRSAILRDRHPLWLGALERVLEPLQVEIVGKTTSTEVALELVAERRPSLLITGIDADDSELDGIECLARARELDPALKGIVLSAHTEPAQIDRALLAGAVAYVIKSAHPEDLLSAIRQAFAHSVYFARPERVPAAPDLGATPLTRREREILTLAAEGRSNAQLARTLWVTEQTVKFHLSNVYRKLNVSNRTEAARWAQLHGLLEARSEQLAG